MIQINASKRLAVMAGPIKTTNSKYAHAELYGGEGFNKAKDTRVEDYVDGIEAYADERLGGKAVPLWTKVAKRLCKDFKFTNDQYGKGTWTDDQSKCKWQVEITVNENGSARLRLSNQTQTHDTLRYKEANN